ncbi:MAG: archaeosortase A [Halobacteria archaeon]|nr:archaeosortase A [Halobacteria archaeon]
MAVNPIIWVAIGLFLLGMAYDKRAKELSAAGWVIFGLFWTLRFPIYYYETHSLIKSALAILALPASLYVAYLMFSNEREDHTNTLIRLSQAVAAMALIYLPFLMVESLGNLLIEHTAAQEYRLLSFLGVNAELTQTSDGLRRLFVVTNPATGEVYRTRIILACTGMGSIAIFGGLITAIRAPLTSKLKAFAVSIPVIYVLNLVRNAFITTAYGYQWFTFGENTINSFFGESQGYASFFWADKVISQIMDLLDDVLEMFGFQPVSKAAET